MKDYRINLGDLLSLLTALCVSAVSVASWYFFSPADSFRRMDPLLERIESAQARNRQDIQLLIDQQKTLELSVSKFDQIINKSYDTIKNDEQKIAIAAMKSSVDNILSRIEKIENSISISPDNAIRSTLAINNINNLKESVSLQNQAIMDHISRLYSIYFWSIGAILVSIILSPILRIIQEKSGPKNSKEQDT